MLASNSLKPLLFNNDFYRDFRYSEPYKVYKSRIDLLVYYFLLINLSSTIRDILL